MARIRQLQTAVLREEARPSDGRLRTGFMREMANTAGRLKQLQKENADVRRRMDDVLRCNARMATMLHQQGRMLADMSRRLDGLQEPKQSWFGRWIDGFRKAA